MSLMDPSSIRVLTSLSSPRGPNVSPIIVIDNDILAPHLTEPPIMLSNFDNVSLNPFKWRIRRPLIIMSTLDIIDFEDENEMEAAFRLQCTDHTKSVDSGK